MFAKSSGSNKSYCNKMFVVKRLQANRAGTNAGSFAKPIERGYAERRATQRGEGKRGYVLPFHVNQ